MTALSYLALKYRHSSKSTWQERLDCGQVLVDDSRAVSGQVLRKGQWLCWCRPPWDEPDVPLSYDVLFEDPELLAVSKPDGLPTMPAGGFLENTLLQLVRKKFPEATPVHRLGRGTSGIVLFARTARSRQVLCAALRELKFSKIYRAFASGIPVQKNFCIEAPIGLVPHAAVGKVYAAHPGGKFARSRVRVLACVDGNSVLEVRPETGRPHQIRIHLAAAGYPLVGDPLYAQGGILIDDSALPGDLGYLLHAERLEFPHPATGRLVEIACPLPPGWPV